MTNPEGLLARLRAQHDDEEHLDVGDQHLDVGDQHLDVGDHQHFDVGDHQHFDVGDVHRPESPVEPPEPPVATSPPQPPHGRHREHQDRGAVPWSAPPANSLFAVLLEPGTTAGSLFSDPEEFYR